MTQTMIPKESASERVAREDLVMFINACFACSGQREFYGGASGQHVSIDFLHRYILGNYRRLYTRTLAAGINHFNQGMIVINLLATGADTHDSDRAEENQLITAALRKLPPQRVYGLFGQLRVRRVNNRRTRSIIKAFIESQRDRSFHAIKYRRRLRNAVVHAHLKFDDELGRFLFHDRRRERVAFEDQMLETFRQAHYSKEAIYKLPYTIAQGFASRQKIPQDEFLKNIAHQMTANEKLRMQKAAAARDVVLDIDLSRAPLTRLAIFIAALTNVERRERRDELEKALDQSAARAFKRTPYKLGRVAAILDRSYSASGTSEKRRRPLAVAMAASALLRQAGSSCQAFWTPRGTEQSDVLAYPGGQTDLATPLLAALRWKPDLIVIVSDGYENSPPGAATQIVKAFREKIAGAESVSVVHLNPVFDADHFAPKTLGPDIPTVGVRSAEDLLTMIGFARFAEGSAPIDELEDYLRRRMSELLAPAKAAA